MKRNVWLKLTIIATLISTPVVFAKDGKMPEKTGNALYTVNITANRTETLDIHTPASITVITKEEIANMGAKNAFDAVHFVPGITSFSYGASGLEYGAMDSRINIRGLERGSLILVNGVPLNLNGKGGLSSIPVSMIDRIEVVKGAASTLYGAEALSGVVNVITRMSKNEFGTATVIVGNDNKGYEVQYGNPDFQLAVKKDFYDGQSPATPIRQDIPNSKGKLKGYTYYTDRDAGDIFNLSMSAKVNDKISVSVARATTHSSYAQVSTETEKAKKDAHSTTYAYKDIKNIASLVYKEDATTGTLFYNDRFLEGKNRPHKKQFFTLNPSNYVARQYGIDAQHEWTFNDNKDYFIGGIFVKRETYKTTADTDFAYPHRNTWSAYGSYSHTINPSWAMIVGLRYNVIADPVKDQKVVVPQWQVLHHVTDDATWFINVGKAFTMPNLSDTFKKDSTTKKYQGVSGKHLKPEEGWNYEIGYKEVHATDSWKVSLFHMNFSNFFDWEPDENGKRTIRVNGGKFKNTGIEGEYTKHVSSHIHATVGASYSNPQKQEFKSVIWKQANPKLQFSTALSYTSDTWEAGTALNYVTKRLKNRDGDSNPDLIAWNAYVGYQFDKYQKIRLDVRNLLNRHNVISNGDWEYWDAPFNYQLSYSYTF